MYMPLKNARRMNIDLPLELHTRLKVYAAKKDAPMVRLIREAIELLLKK